jgi:hypothetical protein
MAESGIQPGPRKFVGIYMKSAAAGNAKELKR